MAGIGLASPAAAEDLVGSMIGDISGWVTDTTGQQVSPQAAVSGDVAVSTDAQGNIVATVTGTASCTGGLGVHINYSATYDTGTGTLSGTYTDPANATPRSIQFTHLGGLQWQAFIADSVVADGQTRPYAITVNLELPSTSLYSGTQLPADRQLSGPLNSTLALNVPVNLPQFGINETISTTMTVAGQWVANVVPQADGSSVINGHATGTYSSSPISLTANITYMGIPMSVPISFSLNGNFGGSLFQDNGALFFAGTYGEIVQGATGGVTVAYSGDMLIDVPVDSAGSISQLPFSFSGSPQVSASSFGSFTVPITVSGIFPFAMN
ncbi:MAG: hypothetical protein V1782_05530 [Pseudomonadota bacterium]